MWLVTMPLWRYFSVPYTLAMMSLSVLPLAMRSHGYDLQEDTVFLTRRSKMAAACLSSNL